MKVLKDFTEKGQTKRWLKGEEYTGARATELAAKGLLGGEAEKEKKEVEPVKEKVELPTLSTEKVKKKK